MKRTSRGKLRTGVAVPELFDVAVGHAGDVIGDGSGEAFCGDLYLVICGEKAGVADER